MMDTAPSTGRPTLDKARARRDAAKVLGVALQTRYRKLLEATGEDEIVIAAADLSQCMYENVEFVIWALKSLGGMNPPPPEVLRRVTPPNQPVNDSLAEDMGAPVCPQCRKGPGHDLGCPNDPRFAKPPVLAIDPAVNTGVAFDLPCSCPPLEHGIIGRDKHMTSCPKFVP